MTCKELQGRMAAYLNGQLAGADEARVREHVAGCAGCRADLAAMRRSLGRVQGYLRREASSVAPAPGAWAELSTRWEDEQPAKRTTRSRAGQPRQTSSVRIRLVLILAGLGLFLAGVVVGRAQLSTPGDGGSAGQGGEELTPHPTATSSDPIGNIRLPAEGVYPRPSRMPRLTLPTPTAHGSILPDVPSPPARPTPRGPADIDRAWPSVQEVLNMLVRTDGADIIEEPPVVLAAHEAPGSTVVFFRYQTIAGGRQVVSYRLAVILAVDGGWMFQGDDGAGYAVGDPPPAYDFLFRFYPAESGQYAIAGIVRDPRITQIEITFPDQVQQLVPVKDGMYLLTGLTSAVTNARPLDANGELVPEAELPAYQAYATPQEALQNALRNVHGDSVAGLTIQQTIEVGGSEIVLYEYDRHDGEASRRVQALGHVEAIKGGWAYRIGLDAGLPQGSTETYTAVALPYLRHGQPLRWAIGGMSRDERIREFEISFEDGHTERVPVVDARYLVVEQPVRPTLLRALDAQGQPMPDVGALQL